MANGTVVSAGDLGGVAATAMAWRVLGGCAAVKKSRGEAKMERGRGRADAGGVKAAPRRVVACADRVLATRGRRRGHAAAMFCAGRPLYIRDSVDSDEQRDV